MEHDEYSSKLYKEDFEGQRDRADRLEKSRTVLLTALMGVRGMAEIEAMSGSATWKRAIAEIDRCVGESNKCLATR